MATPDIHPCPRTRMEMPSRDVHYRIWTHLSLCGCLSPVISIAHVFAAAPHPPSHARGGLLEKSLSRFRRAPLSLWPESPLRPKPGSPAQRPSNNPPGWYHPPQGLLRPASAHPFHPVTLPFLLACSYTPGSRACCRTPLRGDSLPSNISTGASTFISAPTS